ncbi:ammonia-forming cytochrome c nitrite reductase subunit c552 [Aliikangiella sp. IMCC44653]
MKKYNKKLGVLPLGIFFTIVIGAVLAFNLFKGDKTYFLSGDTSHGHYQIELKCNACHVDSFSSADDMQTACESCHAKELDRVSDSHPKKVFQDPRNAELLESLDARYCVSCHREHKPEITRKTGVTLAEDFCFHCHKDVTSERESHAEFKFDSCANSGCHNYHDNSMLYEKFLTKHFDGPDHKEKQLLPDRTNFKRWLKKHKLELPLEVDKADFNKAELANVEVKNLQESYTQKGWQTAEQEWKLSVHAKTAANCSSCHLNELKSDKNSQHSSEFWQFDLSSAEVVKKCESCHKKQVNDFEQSKHGMRLPQGLSALTPQQGRLDLNSHRNQELNCNSCHKPHSLDVSFAAVEACLGCHQDNHSESYLLTPHYQLWSKEQSGRLPKGSGVSCASCHLPRIKKGRNVHVSHNQNENLRPNTKMLRKVCMNCHGLEFSLSALADEALIENNFSRAPDKNHPAIQLVKERIEQKQNK